MVYTGLLKIVTDILSFASFKVLYLLWKNHKKSTKKTLVLEMAN
jgi:hypothetical protein